MTSLESVGSLPVSLPIAFHVLCSFAGASFPPNSIFAPSGKASSSAAVCVLTIRVTADFAPVDVNDGSREAKFDQPDRNCGVSSKNTIDAPADLIDCAADTV